MTVLRRPHTIPTDGLILEILGDGNGNDTSGNGYHATPYNLTYSTASKDYQKQLGSYNGSSSYMDLNASFKIALQSLSSYSFFIHFKTGASWTQYLNILRIEGKQYMGLADSPKNANKIYFQIMDSSNTGRVTYFDWVANTEYVIFGDVYSGGVDLYVNGVKQSFTMTGGAYTGGITNAWVGRESAGYYWNGNIGAIRFWNRRLSDIERNDVLFSHKRLLGFSQGNFEGKYLPEDFSEGLEFLYTGKNLTNTLYDQSGKGVNGTASSVTFGSANQKGLVPMTFNGSSSKIEMGATMRLTGNFTVNAIIKTAVTGSYKQIVQSYSQLSPSVSGYRVFVNNTNTTSFVIGKNTGYTDGTDYKNLTGTINVCDGKNHLVSCVYDGATMKIYIDGTLDVSVAWTFGPAYQADCEGCIGTNNYQQALYTDWYSGDIIFVSGHLKAYTKNHIKRLFTSLFFT